jgi:hypothetical protein
MREAVQALFHFSGLSAVASPWAATLVLHLVLAAYVSAVAVFLVRAARSLTGQPVWPWRLATWLLAVVVLSGGLLTAVALQSFVRYSGLPGASSTAYEVYYVLMFAAPCGLFLWLLHRGKFSANWGA